jgi:hypothetical protein
MQTGLYKHYKGNTYEVIGVATHSEDETKLVVYRPTYGDKALWVRPYEMFTETVVVEGKTLARFTFIGNMN